MNKFILLVCSLLFIQALFSRDKVIISGIISNTEETELLLYGLGGKQIIKLEADGSFNQNIEIKHEGVFNLKHNKIAIPIYLSNNDSIIISADANRFLESIKVVGNQEYFNSYLLEKFKLYQTESISNFKKFYSKNEESFLKTTDSILEQNNILISKYGEMNPKIKLLEQKRIVFFFRKMYANYKIYYSIYTGKNISKAKRVESRILPIINDSITLDEFCFSDIFREKVESKFFKNFSEKFNKNPSNAQSILEESLKEYENPIIKEDLLYYLFKTPLYKNKHEKELYTAIKEVTEKETLKNEINIVLKAKESLVNGSYAPQFNLLNEKGEKVALQNFIGKYVLIDFWATWCKPCVEEIPHLKKIQNDFKDNNIVFISISFDNKSDETKWKNYIAKNDLKGIHLIVENGWNSVIAKDYLINSIPRFVLIDPQGKLVDLYAPRPSESKLTRLLNKQDNL